MMNGERLPASYANFYIANGVVLVPTFNDPNDRVALDTLADLMPSHGRRHPRGRSRLGTWHAALPDAAGAGKAGLKTRLTCSGGPSGPPFAQPHRPIASDTLTAAPGIATPAISW